MQGKKSYTLMRSSLEPFPPPNSRYVSFHPQESAEKAAKVQFVRHVDEGDKKDVDMIYIELRETTMNSDKKTFHYETSRYKEPLSKNHPLYKTLSNVPRNKNKKHDPFIYKYKATPISEAEFEQLFSSHAVSPSQQQEK